MPTPTSSTATEGTGCTLLALALLLLLALLRLLLLRLLALLRLRLVPMLGASIKAAVAGMSHDARLHHEHSPTATQPASGTRSSSDSSDSRN